MRILRNLTVRKKLILLIVTSALFLATIGAISYTYMNQMEKNTDKMYEDGLQPVTWLYQIRNNTRAIDSYVLEQLITTDKAANQDLQKKIEEKLTDTEQLISQYEKMELNANEKEQFKQFKYLFQSYNSKLQKFEDLVLQNKNEVAYNLFIAELKETRRILNEKATQIGDNKVKMAEKISKDNSAYSAQAVTIINTLIVTALVLSIIIGIMITRMITKPLKDIQHLMEKAGEGDFTTEGSYQSKDEIGQLTASFNKMLNGLRSLIKQVTETAEQVAASSEELTVNAEETSKATEQIALTIQEVAAGSTSQIQSVEKTTQSIHELSVGVQQIAVNAQHVSASAGETSEKAFEGNELLNKAVLQMESINHTFNGLAEAIKGLGERSKEIGQIVDTITNIASQTNLLALNAAIEAARAGEHGRGFAVVADEVRKLAEQSALSSQQISHLISAIQSETELTVNSMEKATTEVSEGIQVVNMAGVSFEHIQSLINKVTGQIQDVSAAVQQMAAGTEQVVQTVNSINKIAEDTAAGTQNVSAAAEEQLASMEEITASSSALAKMAEELQIMTEKFKV